MLLGQRDNAPRELALLEKWQTNCRAAQRAWPRDIDREGYPLPCDPVSGSGWWRFNLLYCLVLPGYASWQKDYLMHQLIPVLNWLYYGAIPERQAICLLTEKGT